MFHEKVTIGVSFRPSLLGILPQWIAHAFGVGVGQQSYGYTRNGAIKRAKKNWVKDYRKLYGEDILRSDVIWEVKDE